MLTLKGIRKVSYKSKRTDRQVDGYDFYLTGQRDGVIGEEAFNVFMSDENSAPLLDRVKDLGDLIGLEVDVRYNRYGRAEQIVLV